MSEDLVKRQEAPAPRVPDPTPTPTITLAPAESQAISLRLVRLPLPCGTVAMCIGLQLSHYENTYLIGAMPGWEGGGREPDGALAALVPLPEYQPKYYDGATGSLRPPWPCIEPTMRWINFGRVMGFRECVVSRRLERAWAALETTLRRVANLRQSRVNSPSQAVSDKALVDLIKTRLEGM